jgi:hypothetical protein
MKIYSKKTNLDGAIPTLILTVLLVVIVLAVPIIVFVQQTQNPT